MKVKIIQPAKTAMQSGTAKTKHWVIKPELEDTHFIDPLMGWTGNSDMKQELDLKFETKEQAIAFADASGYDYEVIEPKKRNVVAKAYADNFK